MTHDRPWLLVLLVLVPLTLWVARNSRARLGRRRAALASALRAAAVTALVLALAGFRVGAAVPRATIFSVDTSESVLLAEQIDAARFADTYVRAFGADELVGLVQFGERAAVVSPPVHARELPAMRSDVPASGTDVAAGLVAALSLAPTDGAGHVVLISDGNATSGALEPALDLAVARRLPVSVVPVDNLRGNDLVVEAVRLPATVRRGAPVQARITITSDRRTQARLRVWVGEQLISDGPLAVEPGSREFAVDLSDLGIGFHRIRAELLEDADRRLANNVGEGFVRVAPPGSILSLSVDGATRASDRALQAHGLAVTPSTPAGAAGVDLGRFDAVLVHDLPAEQFPAELMTRLREYVRSGHGLLVAGGPSSYAAGHYEGTVIDDVLPVWSNPKEDRPEPDLALVLVIDRSSSMAAGASHGAAAIDLAIEAAVEAVNLLKEGDVLGVLAFDTDSQWVVPPRPIESPAQVAAIAQRIRGIEIGSSTDLFRALWATRARLTDIEAAIKHVVLLTDGRSTYGDMEALVRSMRRRNITVSSIAIGKEADADLLQRLATAGYGRYYFTDDPRTIPRVLTQETELAGDFAIVEREFQPRLLAPSPIFGGTIQWQEFPRLNGFVRTRAKPTAEVVLSSDSNDPVLAQWQFGRGRVVAWTSDLGGAWSAQWSRWPGFDAFVRQAALWVMASPDDPATTGLYVTTAVAGTQATITIDSLDGRGAYRNGLVTLVELRGPDGVTGAALADQTGPGQYRAELTGLPPGVYEVRVEQRDGAAVTAATTGLVVPFEEELRRNGANLALLRYVAARTGGDVLQQPSDVLRVAARLSAGPGAGSALWLTLGVLAFVADVGVRRVRGTPREVRAQLIDQVESLRARGRALRQLRVRWRRR